MLASAARVVPAQQPNKASVRPRERREVLREKCNQAVQLIARNEKNIAIREFPGVHGSTRTILLPRRCARLLESPGNQLLIRERR